MPRNIGSKKNEVTYKSVRMPPHNIHRNWTERLLGFCPLLSLHNIKIFTVDNIIDNPKNFVELFESFKRERRWNEGIYHRMHHDCSRVDKEWMHLYLHLMKREGEGHVKAFFLHHLLDILDGQYIVEGRSSLLTEKDNSGSFEFKGDFLKVVKKHNLDTEFEEVSSFVREHKNEILQDLNSLSHN